MKPRQTYVNNQPSWQSKVSQFKALSASYPEEKTWENTALLTRIWYELSGIGNYCTPSSQAYSQTRWTRTGRSRCGAQADSCRHSPGEFYTRSTWVFLHLVDGQQNTNLYVRQNLKYTHHLEFPPVDPLPAKHTNMDWQQKTYLDAAELITHAAPKRLSLPGGWTEKQKSSWSRELLNWCPLQDGQKNTNLDEVELLNWCPLQDGQKNTNLDEAELLNWCPLQDGQKNTNPDVAELFNWCPLQDGQKNTNLDEVELFNWCPLQNGQKNTNLDEENSLTDALCRMDRKTQIQM